MRLIDADALKKEMLETYEYEYPTASGAFDEFASRIVPNIISNAPTIDAELVRHGHWINAYPDIEPDPMFMYGICSVCGFEQSISNKLKYCSHCGAKMDEVSK